MKFHSSLNKYDSEYSEKFIRDFPLQLPQSAREPLVVPLYDESVLDCMNLIDSAFQTDSQALLLILVVNARKNSSKEVLSRSLALKEAVARRFNCAKEGRPFSLYVSGPHQILIVDCFSQELRFEDNQGVGLARKLGCDLALRLALHHQIESNWLWTTDCDVQLPSNYFDLGPGMTPLTEATYYRFRHDLSLLDESRHAALACYEISLRYYRMGLDWAGSTYAYHSIGSCLSFSFEAYAKVRGFPRRLAGEDFYLLNKIRKLGEITERVLDPIQIYARQEKRTPFGTSVGMDKAQTSLMNTQDYLLYDPDCFECLGLLLEEISHFSRHRDLKRFEQLLQRASPKTLKALRSYDFRRIFSQLEKQNRDPESLERALLENFDAFQQLKLIHRLTDSGLPKISFREALSTAEFISLDEDLDEPIAILDGLREQDENRLKKNSPERKNRL